MKSVGIFLFALVAGCFAAGLDLDSIEKELIGAPLVKVDTGLSDKRSFGSFFQNACKCEGIKCGCCASPKIFGANLNGCIQFTYIPQKKQLGVELTALNKNVLNRPFSTAKAENICGNLPGKASFLGYCFKTEMTGNDQVGITACSMFEVKVKTATAVTVRFKCAKLQGGQISFIENLMPVGKSVIEVQARNPFKKVVEWLKKK